MNVGPAMIETHEARVEPGERYQPAPRNSVAMWLAAGIGWIWPLTLWGCLHLSWLVAWIILGHRPSPSLDDPKFIDDLGPFLDLSIFAVVVAPWAAMAGLLGTMCVGVMRQMRPGQAMLLVVAYGCLWAGAAMLLYWDPLMALQWYID